MGNKKEYTDATIKSMAIGSAVDMILTDPEKAKKMILVDDRRRVAEVKEEQAQQRSAGYIVLKQAERDDAKGMAESLSEHPLMQAVLAHPKLEAQKTYYARDPTTGLKLQAKPDFVVPSADSGRKIVIDIKTTQDASQDGFSKAMSSYCYDMQAALYLDVVPDSIRFYFAAVESAAPYLCMMYEPHPEDIDRGRGAYQRALWLFAACLGDDDPEKDWQAKETWPGLWTPEKPIKQVELQFWARRDRERGIKGE